MGSEKKRKLRAYSIGGMEKASNGNQWRTEITPFLEELGIEHLNPYLFEPDALRGLQPNRLPDFYTDLYGKKIKPTKWYQLKDAKESHLLNRFLLYMRKIIRNDINLIRNKTDFAIAYINKETLLGAGSHCEICEAFLEGVEVYAIATVEIPAWMRACITQVFLSFDDLKVFLREKYGDKK